MPPQNVRSTALDQQPEGRNRPEFACRGPGACYTVVENAPRATPDAVHFVILQAMLLRESLGISADGSEKLYPQQDCEDFINRQGEVLKFHDRDHRRNVQHVFVSVDPSGGGVSAFAVCSLIMTETGSIQVTFTTATSSEHRQHPHSTLHARAKRSGRCPRCCTWCGRSKG